MAEWPNPHQPVPEAQVPDYLKWAFEKAKGGGNTHPTVKPVSLMRWLVRLACPEGGVVLDPYCGSGTTCVAAVEEGRHYIGIDRDPEFHKLATRRIDHIAEEVGERRTQQAATAMMDDLPQE